MLQTAPRLLRLLSLLQQRRAWSGSALAEALEVTTRTVRNDVNRLRALGYPIGGSPGVEGGYRLRPGNDLPPLLLEDEEAIAIVLGLHSTTAGAISGIEEISLRTLSKLEQLMPKRLRRRIAKLGDAILGPVRAAPPLDVELLTKVARACADQEQLRFEYRAHSGELTRRSTEPYRALFDGKRWYLVAWDLERGAFRTFRIDRMQRPVLGPAFVTRAEPPAELMQSIAQGIERATWHRRARVRVHKAAAELAPRLPKAITLEPRDDGTCIASVGSDSDEQLALYLVQLGADFEVLDSPSLRAHLHELSRRLARAARSTPEPA